jgi:UDP-N-acetylmuramate dehydrogenase
MRIVTRPDMSRRTTLRLGGVALSEILVENDRDWEGIGSFLDKEGGRLFVLGKGSNILADAGEIPVHLLRYGGSSGIEMVHNASGRVHLRVGAETKLPRLVARSARLGCSGLEGLAGIPGTVGGAVAMNAGSFGCEMGRVLERVECWSPKGGLRWLERRDFRTDYRAFEPNIDEETWCVVRAELALPGKDAASVTAAMRRCLRQKKASQPVRAWTCGCVFKNPRPDKPAGMLLEQSGLKGKALGGMSWSELHANFLVNLGDGSSEAAWELIHLARERVRERTGYRLELEVKRLH